MYLDPFLIYIFLSSLIFGFIASAPIGPVNLWTADLLIREGRNQVKWFLIGVILIDLTYVFLGFWSFFFLSDSETIFRASGWEIAGGIFIMMIGFYSLMKNQSKAHQPNFSAPKKSTGPWGAFFTGAFLCASNSMLFIMWLFIAGVYESYGLGIQRPSGLGFVLFGVLIGDIIWFYLFVRLLEAGLTRIKPINMRRLQNLIAISLVLFGLFTACKQIGV